MPTDILILVVILISAVISFMRGFMKEAVNLTTWVAAIAITLLFTHRFASVLPRDYIESPEARLSIGALILFVGTMLISSLIGWVLQKAMPKTVGGNKDRAFGVLFGLVRGGIIITLFVLAANLVPATKKDQWWVKSRTLPFFQGAARMVHAYMPEDLAKHFDFTTRQ